jgi:hypothetical protein
MKKILISILLTMLSTNAFANYIFYSESKDHDTFFYDPSTISKKGDFVDVWIYTNIASNEGSLRGYIEINCRNKTLLFLTSTSFSGKDISGKMGITLPADKQPEFIPPNTPYNTLMQLVCK